MLLEQLVEKNCFRTSWISLLSLGAHLRATCGNLVPAQIAARRGDKDVVRFPWWGRGGFQYRRSLGWILLYILSEHSRLVAEFHIVLFGSFILSWKSAFCVRTGALGGWGWRLSCSTWSVSAQHPEPQSYPVKTEGMTAETKGRISSALKGAVHVGGCRKASFEFSPWIWMCQFESAIVPKSRLKRCGEILHLRETHGSPRLMPFPFLPFRWDRHLLPRDSIPSRVICLLSQTCDRPRFNL